MLAAERPDLVSALVLEEEILPGIDAAIPEPGASVYPCWHGPFNRAVGLAEALVPGREDAYFGQFLKESAGPSGLERDALDEYVAAYRPAHALGASLAYYRTRAQDIDDVIELRRACPAMPVLAIGGRFGMGHAVAAGARQISDDVRDIVLPLSGHYPAEQEPMEFSDAVLRFVSHSPSGCCRGSVLLDRGAYRTAAHELLGRFNSLDLRRRPRSSWAGCCRAHRLQGRRGNAHLRRCQPLVRPCPASRTSRSRRS